MEMELHELSEEQRLMRQTCRAFVDGVVSPFIRDNWKWDMTRVAGCASRNKGRQPCCNKRNSQFRL